ncbi:YeeE/YedE family protein [Alphaproteobacteria bacterium]|jgi:uncharacterized protein|nr:YeeE/YedE family protein [Alphaproteobacteria bacterium]MBT5798969.1 YeeE/YedE family protein [Alphaproteobacteria bacterium]MDA9190123.1 YeeE/YedE family protein [Alphaproteobacteria bacterium]MDA9816032.1 YeeE/YedE family protein [Alphaproteobacteria bacterium]MDC0394992.1 YeeE/YedE family protein [Alphaproteobacteria bacterium]
MISILVALVVGCLFGIGLAFGGMLDPSKVVGFLDIFGAWDPSLAFVMIGGIGVNALGHFFLVKGKKPIFAKKFQLPENINIDRNLLVGSALFGIGWGLAGLCPGPVVASILLNPMSLLPFLGVMLVGLKIGSVLKSK